MIAGWKVEFLSTAEEVFSKLITLRLRKNFWVFRGSNSVYDYLYSSIDREFHDKRLNRDNKISLESQSIESFRMNYKHLQLTDVFPLLQVNIQTLMLMQHYGAKTRLLDWTTNPYIALYFAVCNDQKEDEDGQILGFEYKRYEFKGSQQWCHFPEMYTDQGEFRNYLEPAFEKAYEGDWIVGQFLYKYKFPRILAQDGLFTFCPQFSVDHASKIKKLLDNTDCHKIFIINKKAKSNIRKILLTKYQIWHGNLFPDPVGAANASNELLSNSILEIQSKSDEEL